MRGKDFLKVITLIFNNTAFQLILLASLQPSRLRICAHVKKVMDLNPVAGRILISPLSP